VSDSAAEASTDASGDAPPAALGCNHAGVTLCDGFEGATLDPATWTVDTQSGTVALDTTRAHTGARSVHVHIDSGDTHAYIVETKTFPAAGDAFYGRAYVYLSAPAPTVHATLFEASQATPFADYSVGGQFLDIITNYYWSTPFDEGVHGGTQAMPTGRWACFEWQFDGGMHTSNVWLDGAPVSDALSTNWPAMHFDHLSLGLRLVAQDSTSPSGFDAWLDDVAVGTTRVQCM
jgi:hypothetical protein